MGTQENSIVKRRRAVWFLLIAALLWSTGGLLIKAVQWHPLAISGFRSAIATIVIWFAFRGSPLQWSLTTIIGALGYAGVVTLFVLANKLTTAANAIFLQYTAPIYVALLGGWLLGEKTSRQDWITIITVFIGMGLFFMDQMSPGGLMGNLFAIASGVSFAVFVIAMRKQKDSHPFVTVLLGNVITFFIGLPFMFDSAPELNGWGTLIFLGIFQLALPYILYTKAIQAVSALEAIMIPVIEPILNPLWVFLIIGETPGVWSLVGGIIILGSITGRYLLAVPVQKSGQPNDE